MACWHDRRLDETLLHQLSLQDLETALQQTRHQPEQHNLIRNECRRRAERWGSISSCAGQVILVFLFFIAITTLFCE